MNPSELTIAIATYNGEAFVSKAVSSALATGAHVIVSDDNSTDATLDMLAPLAPRIELVRQPRNLGIAGQYQFLLEACETPLALLLNQDDLILPDRLKKIQLDPAEVTVLNGWVIDGQGRRLRPIYRRPPFHATVKGVYRGLRVESFVMTPSQVIFPTRVALDSGGFVITTDPGQGAEDWMCWLRLAATGTHFRLRLRPAMAYRKHDANYSHRGASFHIASRQAVRERFPHPPERDDRLRLGW